MRGMRRFGKAGTRLTLLASIVAVSALSAFSAVGAPTADAVSSSSGTRAGQTQSPWTIGTYGRYITIIDGQVSPGGRYVAYSLQRKVRGGRMGWESPRAYVAATNGRSRRPLTSNRSSSAVAWSPNGRFIAFLSSADKGRSAGVPNVWVKKANGRGPARQLTRAARGVISFSWSPDGKSIAYVVGDTKSTGDGPVVAGEHPNRANLWLVRQGKKGWLHKGVRRTARRLTDRDFAVGSLSWSPDSRTIAFERQVLGEAGDSYDIDILLLDIRTRRATAYAATEAAETSPHFSPDGSRIAYKRSDLPASDFSAWRVVVGSATGGAAGARAVLAPTPNEEPKLLGWSRDGRSLYYAETRGTTVQVASLPADGSPSEDITAAEGVLYPTSLSPGGRHLLAGRQTWSEAQELWVARLPAQASAIPSDPLRFTRVTGVNRAMRSYTSPRQELISWQMPDGWTIEGLLTYPLGYEEGRRYPMLLYVHGGPAGGFQDSHAGNFDIYPVAVFAQRGYAMLRVNCRGSVGYGAAFRKANIQDFGGGDYRDLMAGVDRVIAMGVADPDRLGIMGWSYGGFMSAWATTQTQRFVAASVGAGPVDWVSMAGTDDLPDLVPAYFGGLPWEVADVYFYCSPVSYAAQAETPTLIQHGLCDARVPYSQGEEWYFTLQELGVPVTMVSYPRSGHVVMEPDLIRDVYQRNLDWFARYLPTD
jgi:dipeptidyl aminopeptidase/acylaminoacyl peptidase